MLILTFTPTYTTLNSRFAIMHPLRVLFLKDILLVIRLRHLILAYCHARNVVRFSLFCKQNGAFWLAKSKAINFSFKDYFDRSICSFQRLAGQKKTIL